MNFAVRNIVRDSLRSIGTHILVHKGKLTNGLVQSEPWEDNQEFNALMSQIEQHTLVTVDRCFNIYQYAKYAGTKAGEIAEVGVFRGGTGRLLAKVCPHKPVHLFDTFVGMPVVNPIIDRVRENDFSDTSLKAVKQFLSDCENTKLHPGFFPKSAGDIINRSFCLVHIDVDIYQSVKDSLKFFYERMVSGGILIFDDYGWRSCPGVKKAIEEFLVDKAEFPIITSPSQCLIIKT